MSLLSSLAHGSQLLLARARGCWAVRADKRWSAMEDAHTIALALENGSADVNSFFAVYDGHGGASRLESDTGIY